MHDHRADLLNWIDKYREAKSSYDDFVEAMLSFSQAEVTSRNETRVDFLLLNVPLSFRYELRTFDWSGNNIDLGCASLYRFDDSSNAWADTKRKVAYLNDLTIISIGGTVKAIKIDVPSVVALLVHDLVNPRR